MKNSADLGGCYPPRPSASVDSTLLDLQNSSYPTKPHSIIAKYHNKNMPLAQLSVVEEITKLQTLGAKQLEKSTYLENQSRRNNVRIEGIVEEPRESWESTEGDAH